MPRAHVRRPGPSHRQERVGEAIRHALSEILARGEVPDPDLNRRSLTVTAVEMTPDLKWARVFITPLGGQGAKEALAALEAQRKALRALVSRRVNLKFAPDLKFVADDSFAARALIDDLLRSPAVARDLAGAQKDGSR